MIVLSYDFIISTGGNESIFTNLSASVRISGTSADGNEIHLLLTKGYQILLH